MKSGIDSQQCRASLFIQIYIGELKSSARLSGFILGNTDDVGTMESRMKIIKFLALSGALVLISSSAKAEVADSGAINGKIVMICEAKGGTEYILNAELFPQMVEIDSDYYNLKRTYLDKGTRYMDYLGTDAKWKVRIHVTNDRKTALTMQSISDEKMKCS